MRSAEQIGRTVGEWHDFQREERERSLRQVLAMLREARESRAEWYLWILAGRPPVKSSRYGRSTRRRGRALQSALGDAPV